MLNRLYYSTICARWNIHELLTVKVSYRHSALPSITMSSFVSMVWVNTTGGQTRRKINYKGVAVAYVVAVDVCGKRRNPGLDDRACESTTTTTALPYTLESFIALVPYLHSWHYSVHSLAASTGLCGTYPLFHPDKVSDTLTFKDFAVIRIEGAINSFLTPW
ncbi:hypothetical protein KQX54_017305 [Cotesia glomerata]|uniref:Uncharacterized protein n=1 Tax=Cotesia glomerata TaxID=32391 RepID=A0AAV7IGA0_COTGL|nr:hypothetical protein KQX54_017305 [Cotesia glomerata]